MSLPYTADQGPQPGISNGAVLADAAGATNALTVVKEGPPERGGRDPEALQVITKHKISSPVLRIGHTTDYADPGAPVVVCERDDVRPGPDGLAYADVRCSRCIGKTFLALGEHESVLTIQHRPGCRVMAGLLAEAGVTA